MTSTRALALVIAFAAASAGATTWTVDLQTDEQDGACVAGDCSLREAIASSAENDDIVFALTGAPPWTIPLQTVLGPLVIDHSLTVTGPGTASLAVSGDPHG